MNWEYEFDRDTIRAPHSYGPRNEDISVPESPSLPNLDSNLVSAPKLSKKLIWPDPNAIWIDEDGDYG